MTTEDKHYVIKGSTLDNLLVINTEQIDFVSDKLVVSIGPIALEYKTPAFPLHVSMEAADSIRLQWKNEVVVTNYKNNKPYKYYGSDVIYASEQPVDSSYPHSKTMTLTSMETTQNITLTTNYTPTLTSVDNSVLITQTEEGYDLKVLGGGGGGTLIQSEDKTVDVESIPGGYNLSVDVPVQISTHNVLGGRDSADSHPMESITGLYSRLESLDNGYNAVNNKFTEQLEEVNNNILTAYKTGIGLGSRNDTYGNYEYEGELQASLIHKDGKIYKALRQTTWTGMVNADWEQVFPTIEEMHTYVANSIEAAASGEFPLQMRPDSTNGTYQTIEDAPLTDNQLGYLIAVVEDSAGGNAGLYIWSKVNENDPLSWLPFVSFPTLDQDNIMVTFRGETKSLRLTMVDVDTYITDSIKSETEARTQAEASINNNISALQSHSLQIGSNIFRGTQAEYDADPEKESYFLALIVEG